jgi:hypothetical protein
MPYSWRIGLLSITLYFHCQVKVLVADVLKNMKEHLECLKGGLHVCSSEIDERFQWTRNTFLFNVRIFSMYKSSQLQRKNLELVLGNLLRTAFQEMVLASFWLSASSKYPTLPDTVFTFFAISHICQLVFFSVNWH